MGRLSKKELKERVKKRASLRKQKIHEPKTICKATKLKTKLANSVSRLYKKDKSAIRVEKNDVLTVNGFDCDFEQDVNINGELPSDKTYTKFTDDSTVFAKDPLEVDTPSSVVAPDLLETDERIKSNLSILLDFKNYDGGRARFDILSELKRDLASFYGYNEYLMEMFVNLFPIADLIGFIEASEKSRPITIRSNSLKCRRRDLAQSLIARGINLDPLGDWSNAGLSIIHSTISIGATPEYLGGHYMLQGASSLLSVIALAPKPNETILDMCAAPGGKSTYISALMRNTGILIANDASAERLAALSANVHRMGVKNCVITNYDGRYFTKIGGKYDRILLDAPCTGTGIISKDPSVKISKEERDIRDCSFTQKELILAAIDCLKVSESSCLVYSTCSVLVEENEAVINYAIKKRHVKLLDTGLSFGCEGFTSFRGMYFHPSLTLTRRFFPHVHDMDGFFVAKLQKLSDKKLNEPEPKTWINKTKIFKLNKT